MNLAIETVPEGAQRGGRTACADPQLVDVLDIVVRVLDCVRQARQYDTETHAQDVQRRKGSGCLFIFR